MDKKQGWDEFRKRLNEPPEMTDTLIRHKWPEEKPEKGRRYLIRIRPTTQCGDVQYLIRNYECSTWSDFSEYITHWWELPEV